MIRIFSVCLCSSFVSVALTERRPLSGSQGTGVKVSKPSAPWTARPELQGCINAFSKPSPQCADAPAPASKFCGALFLTHPDAVIPAPDQFFVFLIFLFSSESFYDRSRHPVRFCFSRLSPKKGRVDRGRCEVLAASAVDALPETFINLLNLLALNSYLLPTSVSRSGGPAGPH